jgi:hypothetical protein
MVSWCNVISYFDAVGWWILAVIIILGQDKLLGGYVIVYSYDVPLLASWMMSMRSVFVAGRV